MNRLTLRLKSPLRQRLNMEPFTPERLLGKGLREIATIPLWQGRQQIAAGDLFSISGRDSTNIVIQADSDRLDYIGAGMGNGQIRIEGGAGAYLGYTLRGGVVTLNGNAGIAAGCAMAGGTVHINGNAGSFLGGAATGARQGVCGGKIVVTGNAGDRVGDLMRRGIIMIGGNVGDYCGSRMVAGSIVACGQTGIGTGLGMRRGTLLLTRTPTALPATFSDNGSHVPGFLTLLIKSLREDSLWPLAGTPRVRRWLGDLAYAGQGEILICE